MSRVSILLEKTETFSHCDNENPKWKGEIRPFDQAGLGKAR
jgi:hypothetical protein